MTFVMERDPACANPLLARAERTKVLGGLRGFVRGQLKRDTPSFLRTNLYTVSTFTCEQKCVIPLAHLDVEENLWVACSHASHLTEMPHKVVRSTECCEHDWVLFLSL